MTPSSRGKFQTKKGTGRRNITGSVSDQLLVNLVYFDILKMTSKNYSKRVGKDEAAELG